MDSEPDDYELTGSEQEYDEEEREILENLHKERKQRKQDPKQEVLAFSEDEDEDLMHDSDIEGAGSDDNGHLPDTMDWGSKRSTYYNTDFVDPDYSSYNAQEEELAKAEEEEAKKIQRRLAKQMSEADFQLDDVPVPVEDDDDDDDHRAEHLKITSDLTGLNERERLQLLQKDSPEFLGLVQDFQQHMEEVQQLISPVLNYVRNHQVLMVPALQFASLYHNILVTYCSNVSFYLLLKAKRSSVKFHPVVKRLVQLKKLREQLAPRYEELIRPQMEALLERIQEGEAFTVVDVKQRQAKPKPKTQMHILDKYNQTEEDGEAEDDSDEEEEEKEEEDEEQDTEANDTRRGITYQIAKNKGLTPHRKKEQRNPRVKHRGKYRKALVRRKGAVRTVRKELQRYGGEISGIKSTVTKSVKFRT